MLAFRFVYEAGGSPRYGSKGARLDGSPSWHGQLPARPIRRTIQTGSDGASLVKQQTTDLRGFARRLLAAMPATMGDMLRGTKRAILNARSRRAVFMRIADSNAWDGTESISGPGSTMEATRLLRAALPDLLAKYEVQSLLDVPCGDAYWITSVLPKGIKYTGGDIVPALIEKARTTKGEFGTFAVMDLVTDELPRADLVLVRDCFIHLPNVTIVQAIANIKRSGARLLLTSTYPGRAKNIDIEIGGFRPVDLQALPFGLPQPLETILETEGLKNGKSIALWDISTL